jgi:hypothetical protein
MIDWVFERREQTLRRRQAIRFTDGIAHEDPIDTRGEMDPNPAFRSDIRRMKDFLGSGA